MRNHWTRNKIAPKGVPFWTFEIYDEGKTSLVPETCVELDERPELKIVESLESDGKWVPVYAVWEDFTLKYTERTFLENKSGIRLLEIDGEQAGILRGYDEHGEQTESWVMHGLRMKKLAGDSDLCNVTFAFHHANYFYQKADHGQ